MPKSSKITQRLDPETETKVVEKVQAGRRGLRRLHIYIIVAFVVILSVAGFAAKIFILDKTANSSEVPTLIEKIGRHILLPDGETPTVATVADIALLSGQEFFAKAENGDKVLFYGDAKKAILYRPSKDLVINVAPLEVAPQLSPNISTATPSASQSEAKESQPVKVTILNGTGKSGLARTAQKALEESSLSSLDFSGLGNASVNYDTTKVIDVTGTKGEIVSEIVNIIGGEGASSADDETVPQGTEVLIILGSDYVKE